MADLTLAVSGGAGLVSPGSLIPNRAVGLSGWFSPAVWLSGVVGAGASGTVVYGTGGGSDYSWLLVDRANRLIDWTYAGVPGGIKTRTVEHIVTGLYGDDAHDDYAVLQAAINACPAGHVVKINFNGIFKLGSPLNPGTNPITVRGVGPGTVLKGYSSGNPSVIQMGPSSAYNFTVEGRAIDSGYQKGSTSITLSSGTGFTAGRLMLVDQLNDGTLVTDVGSSGTANWVDRGTGTRALRQLVKITAVNGNVVNFSPPLFYTFSPALNPQASCLSQVQPLAADGGGIGLENLTVEDAAGNGGGARWTVTMNAISNSWLYKVYLKNSFSGHIKTKNILQCTFKLCYVDGAYQMTPSHAYGFEISDGSCSNLIEDSIVYRTSAEFMLEDGASGNVVAYCCGETAGLSGRPDAELPVLQAAHGAHPMFNLFEGCDGTNFTADDSWGSSSHTMIFRNFIPGWYPGMNFERFCLYIDKLQTYLAAIGNTMGVAGKGFVYEHAYPTLPNTDGDLLIYRLGYSEDGSTGSTQVAATLLRHGNFDVVNNAVVWDGGIAARDIPASLYLTSKPAWLGSLSWPVIGPDVSGYKQDIPARKRLDAYKLSGNLADLFADAT